jgi:tellurite methyltransferase
MAEDSEYWSRYYQVTVERPAWRTVRRAIELFAAEDRTAAPAGGSAARPGGPRLAVDLGCGAGRDARELLRAGWRVIAMDREPEALRVLTEAAGPDLAPRLKTRLADLATVLVPACDLVNASLCLPFLEPDAYAATWVRVVDALPAGGRLAAMLFGDRDDSATDPTMTCPAPERVEADLAGFAIEHWSVTEEDTTTALGEPHHFHLIEVVARRLG